MGYDFEILTITPFFKTAILRREKIFSPERRSKVVKFAKNDHLDALIILARDELFYFSLENGPKGGPLDDIFSIFHFMKSYNFLVFAFLSPLLIWLGLFNI